MNNNKRKNHAIIRTETHTFVLGSLTNYGKDGYMTEGNRCFLVGTGRIKWLRLFSLFGVGHTDWSGKSNGLLQYILYSFASEDHTAKPRFSV